MTKTADEHDSTEFGQPSSHGIKGLDPPMIGAPVSIIIDGIVERESGVTPPPPLISVKAVVVALVVMVLLGIGILVLVTRFAPPPSDEPIGFGAPERFEQVRPTDA